MTQCRIFGTGVHHLVFGSSIPFVLALNLASLKKQKPPTSPGLSQYLEHPTSHMQPGLDNSQRPNRLWIKTFLAQRNGITSTGDNTFNCRSKPCGENIVSDSENSPGITKMSLAITDLLSYAQFVYDTYSMLTLMHVRSVG
jgi:hypothetical protein